MQSHDTLQVVVYPTNDCYLGTLRLRGGGGGTKYSGFLCSLSGPTCHVLNVPNLTLHTFLDFQL
jgi:hypothetical protein